MARAAVGLGSNLGDRRAHLAQAVDRLGEAGEVMAVSSLYETAPIGGPEQGPFLNAVAVVETALTPRALLDRCLGLEREAGRRRRVRWGPRPLDLDLLLYGEAAVDEPGLRVPHPRLAARRFVLEPLLEAWPEAALPDGTPVSGLLAGVAGQEAVLLAGPGWWDDQRLLDGR
ncbi:MAG: 2-amino-4-hydroxy-6-hydroxymethyldihydropteridine diphosphokinase [Actinobacteria bacterium]|nr:2-amino-4-hydroxy-6-hydroxymethyldihydropteridine diphosphokinase [Actinomycetota bacterium]